MHPIAHVLNKRCIAITGTTRPAASLLRQNPRIVRTLRTTTSSWREKERTVFFIKTQPQTIIIILTYTIDYLLLDKAFVQVVEKLKPPKKVSKVPHMYGKLSSALQSRPRSDKACHRHPCKARVPATTAPW